MVSIHIRQLVKRFGDFTALRQLDLDIEAGELFFLLGPSGCGKTTLLRAIAGFHFPEEGSIHFGDQDVTRVPPHRRETGMMFQSYALWPHFNVFRNVAFGLEEQRVPRPEINRRVEEALAMVKMEGLGSRKINQLSGGQQQRVALARALVVRPRCLLLDEPLSNLDSKLRIEMRGEIRRICKEFGLTAIYVTHDQKEALSMADRMAILDGGRIAQVGTPEEVYRRPRTPLVAAFVGETNLIPGVVIEADPAGIAVETAMGTLMGHVSDPDWVPSKGAQILLSIRPECLSLVPDAPGPHGIRGHLTETTYLGETAQYVLQPPGGGEPLRISELNPRRVIRDHGEALHTAVDPMDVVVLPAS